jgi:hypothetical protein
LKRLRELAERSPFAVSLLLALALLLVPYRTLLGPGVPSGRDLVPYFYPLKAHLVEALRAGEMPWIDRYRWGGLPLLSWPGVAAFDPGNILLLLLPAATAAKAWMLLRVLSGAAGFAVFLRVTGLPPLSSALGALAWGASGITASSANFLGFSSACAALPWFAAALVRVRAERSARSTAFLAVATALVLAASVPEPLLMAVVVAIVLLAGRGAEGGALERIRTAALWGGAGLLGALLAAPPLGALFVTGIENIRSVRGALLPTFAAQGALPPARLVELIADGVVADWTTTAAVEGVPVYPYFPSSTPGRVAWTLALLGLVAGRGSRLRASTLATLGVLLALGPATPVAGWLLRAVPFASAIRYPEKWMVLFGFGMVWLAALGAAVLERAVAGRRAAAVFGLLAGLLALDRAFLTPRLIPISPASLLEQRPALLGPLPAARGDEPPPRLLSLNALRLPAGASTNDPRLVGETMNAWAVPWTPSRYGVASVLDGDYDAALPRPQFEWAILLEQSPAEGPLAAALARWSGALGVIETGRGAEGRLAPRLRLLSNPVAPVRFVSRVVREGEPRAAADRFLFERAAVDTAFLTGRGEPLDPSAGRVLRVSDRPSRLEIEVEVDGPGPAYLLVCRPIVAASDAEVDGRPATVDETVIGYSGIAVPKGRHVVRLRPHRGWLIIAAVISALGLVAVTLLFRRRRPVESPA